MQQRAVLVVLALAVVAVVAEGEVIYRVSMWRSEDCSGVPVVNKLAAVQDECYAAVNATSLIVSEGDDDTSVLVKWWPKDSAHTCPTAAFINFFTVDIGQCEQLNSDFYAIVAVAPKINN